MGIAVLVVYGLLLGFILLFSLGQLHLTVAYLRQKGRPAEPEPPLPVLPWVTVQLPVFNERHVVERLIDRVCAFDWPLDRLEVQVLDDSDDETVDLAAARCALWRERGVDIVHLRRGERTGYKAGALAFGTARAKGELIAIFDADFLPDADFLRRTVPWFADPGIGMVQTR
ncbi:MAG: glycosyltransferase, partial [Flavobacteriales bacterium]|nr:glycosyltransferase [Flavobacteriales bacterium]